MSDVRAFTESARTAEREGRWDDAISAYERAMGLVPADGTPSDAAEILRRLGIVRAERGELELAGELYEASLEVAERSDLRRHSVAALVCLATLSQLRGDLAEARGRYESAQALAADLGDERLLAVIEHNLGTLLNIHGDLEGALECYRSSLERHRGLGDEVTAARALVCMGMAHVDLGEWSRAEASFDEASVLAVRMQDHGTIGGVEINRAELYVRRGDFERARESCDRASEIFNRLDSGSGIAESHKFYGIIFRESGNLALAETHFDRGAGLARHCHDRLLEAEVSSEWALLHLAGDRNREALHCLNGAHQAFQELHARRELLDLGRRLDALETTYLRVVRAWGESIESKDLYTAGHCERVANYACMLAQSMGIQGRDLTWLRMGGFLHDVGKIAVPPEVLNKPGKLTPEEWTLMQRHTVEGDTIVAELNFPWDIRPVVRSHHERWDGSGYPDGLAGEAIPFTARILCVADVYDALTTARSYRPALSQEEALGIMEGDAGRIFDPALFETFRELIQFREPSRDGRFPELGAAVVAA